MSLAAAVRKLGRRPTATVLADIDKRRLALAKRIDAFLAKTPFGVDENVNAAGNRKDNTNWDDEEEAAQSLEVDRDVDEDLAAAIPENQILPLPSNFKAEHRAAKGISQSMMAAEIKIRIGQADETLHEIRTIVGHKSYVFREELRKMHGVKNKTRKWDKVDRISNALRRECRIYNRCRDAMESLNPEHSCLKRYQKLSLDDVKASTAVVAENEPGNRGPNLSWIWTMNVKGDTDSVDWLEECECKFMGKPIITPLMVLDSLPRSLVTPQSLL